MLSTLPLLAFRLTGLEIGVIVVVVLFALWVASARKPGRRCKRCQELNREHALYCAQCGEKLFRK